MIRNISPYEKARKGMFLSLRELAEVVGFGRVHMLQIAKRPDFPLFEKKVRLADFDAWYRLEAGISVSLRSVKRRLINDSPRVLRTPARLRRK